MSRVLVTSCKPNPKVSHNHATTIRLRRLNYLDIEGAQSVKCENVLSHQSHINVAVISNALKFHYVIIIIINNITIIITNNIMILTQIFL